jgi:hypothetical protein
MRRRDGNPLPTVFIELKRTLLVTGLQAIRSGRIQICRKCTSSLSDALYSLWLIPVPALMRCTSPTRITELVPCCLCAPTRLRAHT